MCVKQTRISFFSSRITQKYEKEMRFVYTINNTSFRTEQSTNLGQGKIYGSMPYITHKLFIFLF